MRQRLSRNAATDYQVRRDNYSWVDHILRVQITGALISWFRPDTILDPACGDGTIVAAAHVVRSLAYARLADVSRPNFYFVGTEMRPRLPEAMRVSCQSIEETLGEDNHFDLVVLTEILEHIEDPVTILRMARQRATNLVASSPLIAEGGYDDNSEHLWQFDATGYREMLKESGWEPVVCVPVHLTPAAFVYDFQIWGCQ